MTGKPILRTALLAIFVGSFFALPVHAQGFLHVRSNDPDAGVLIDSTWVGRAKDGPFSLAAGQRFVRVVPGIVGTWGVMPVDRIVQIVDGDTVTVHGHFSALSVVAREGRERHGGVVRLEPPGRRTWIDYAAIGTALAAGAVAVHYKMKADARFDVYRETGDPALRPRIRELDTRSGIAAATMQVGFTVFAIRLLRR